MNDEIPRKHDSEQEQLRQRYNAFLAELDAHIETLKLQHSPVLIAVSKTRPVPDIQTLYEAGHRDFGENRVQELQEKAPKLPADIRWHLIGHLQRNKVRPAVRYAHLIHSVDSEKLLRRIDLIAGEEGKIQDILIQVKLSEEPTKSGTLPETVPSLTELALSLAHIRLHGFMTIAAVDADEAACLATFERLAAIRNELASRFCQSFPILSMGMSNDYVPALKAGATHIRIGSRIFGARRY